jgi:hypothetical protein
MMPLDEVSNFLRPMLETSLTGYADARTPGLIARPARALAIRLASTWFLFGEL